MCFPLLPNKLSVFGNSSRKVRFSIIGWDPKVKGMLAAFDDKFGPSNAEG